MSSQIKTEPKVVKGETFLAVLGEVTFKWTIKDFKLFLELGQAINSPSFEIETTYLSLNVRSFHLEMEIPNENMECPVFLVNEMGEQITMTISLESSSPQRLTFNAFVTLEANVFVFNYDEYYQTRKKVMTVNLPTKNLNFPDEVAITIKMTLCKVAEQLVS
jgi:hypothetical protein